MPNPNLLNPVCLTCGKPTTYNMTLESGARQYRCRRHKPNYTVTDSDLAQGRPTIGDKPLTQVEINQRYRDRHQRKYLKAKSVRMKRTRKALKLIKAKETE